MQRQKLSKSRRSEKRVDSLLTNNWKGKFFVMLQEETNKLFKRLKEYNELSPKNVEYTIKSGIDTLNTTLVEKKDILITSPPYLQSQEYIRQAKLDLFWLGYSEDTIKKLSKLEIPYRDIPSLDIKSDTFKQIRSEISEKHILDMFERYFGGVLGAFTHLQKSINSYMFIFVGRSSLRGRSIPLDLIITEHLSTLDWIHEKTLVDKIVSRRMFNYAVNPASGIKDSRTTNEHLDITWVDLLSLV